MSFVCTFDSLNKENIISGRVWTCLPPLQKHSGRFSLKGGYRFEPFWKVFFFLLRLSNALADRHKFTLFKNQKTTRMSTQTVYPQYNI